MAAWGGNLEVVKILLAKGADMNVKDSYADGELLSNNIITFTKSYPNII